MQDHGESVEGGATSHRMAITCPQGVEPGQLIEVEAPWGNVVQVIVPDDVAAGDEFELDLPSDERQKDEEEGVELEGSATDSIDLEYLLGSGSSSGSEKGGPGEEEEDNDAAHLAALDQEFANFAAGAQAQDATRQARFADLEAARAQPLEAQATASGGAEAALAESGVAIICPEGVEPGQLIEVEGPSGASIQLTVPDGVTAGETA